MTRPRPGKQRRTRSPIRPVDVRSFLDWQTHGVGSNAEYPYHVDVPVETLDWLTERDHQMYAWRRGWQPVDAMCVHANNFLFRPRDAAIR